MLKRHQITAAIGSDNVTSFRVGDVDGGLIDLDALGVTAVKVIVCSCLNNAQIDATWAGSVIDVIFGSFNLPVGLYKPKITYYNPSNPNGVVIVGDSFLTEIELKLVC